VCNNSGACIPAPSCEEYCEAIFEECTDKEHLQYASKEICLATCALLPPGVPGAASGNSVGCRLTHAGLAAENAHCYHAGPGGSAFGDLATCGTNCDGFCTIAMRACAGTPSAYDNRDECISECGSFADNVNHNTSATGNNLACRLQHLTLASVTPATHCPHIREKSTVCVAPMPSP
jgi:hypothetical protein